MTLWINREHRNQCSTHRTESFCSSTILVRKINNLSSLLRNMFDKMCHILRTYWECCSNINAKCNRKWSLVVLLWEELKRKFHIHHLRHNLQDIVLHIDCYRFYRILSHIEYKYWLSFHIEHMTHDIYYILYVQCWYSIQVRIRNTQSNS